MRQLTVGDAARQLGVGDSRVRQMLRTGELPGERHGPVWMVDASAVAQRASRPMPGGRPLSPVRAWALLDLLDGGSAPWLTAQGRSQVRARARALLGAPPERLRAALRNRDHRHRLQAHPAAVRRLAADEHVLVAGAAGATRAGLDLVTVGATIEVYVRQEHLQQLIDQYMLRAASTRTDVVVRIPREVWPFRTRSVGPAVLAADLLESEEPRAVAAGTAWLTDHLVAEFGRVPS
jgi:excisionase family DNA binding protein